MYKSVFVNDIHNQLMTSVNPEISCIRMGSGPALFGLVRFYCIVVSISACYAEDPGSIPGRGAFFFKGVYISVIILLSLPRVQIHVVFGAQQTQNNV